MLSDLSVEIPRGITYCLLGPNGSGKTTFIRSVVGLLRLDSGTLTVLDTPVSNVGSVYSRIGYMTQHKALYPDLTLQENLEFYAGLYGLSRQKREERISELLEMVDLGEHRGRLAGALSGGMYQRLSLACTLIHEPELLLLDEPTVGVDPRLRHSFWQYFERLAGEGRTVLITTHLMDEAARCRRVGYMKAGRMAAEGAPEELIELAGLRPAIMLWLEDPERDSVRLRAAGYEFSLSNGVARLSLESRASVSGILDAVRPKDMRMIEPTLEEAFLRLSEER